MDSFLEEQEANRRVLNVSLCHLDVVLRDAPQCRDGGGTLGMHELSEWVLSSKVLRGTPWVVLMEEVLFPL